MSSFQEDTEMSQDSDCSAESDIEMTDDLPMKKPLQTNKDKESMAEELKTQGNEKYKQKKYDDAIKLYSKALDLCPTCAAYYGNRAACYMMTCQFDLALADARKSTQIDPTFLKGYMREAKCHLSMGEIAACINSYDKALQIEPKNNVAISELEQARQVQKFIDQADIAFNHRDYRKVVFCMDRCSSFSPSCQLFKIKKAECLALIRRYQEAQEIANDILRWEGTNADAIYVRGLCLYYQDNIDKAFQHFQQVLRLAPDHHKSKTIYKKAKLLLQKKEEGNNAFRTKNLQEAHQLYTEALAIDPDNIFTNSKLYCNRATVSCKLHKNKDAIADCSKAIELDDAYLKAYLRRAKCYMDLEQYEEAVRDYEKIYKMDKNRENRELLQAAKLELKKSKRKDFYKILGVGKNCTEDEIKKAYKKRALLHHPDRHAGATDEQKKEEEQKFKEIGEAYSILSDPKKKQRYDSGQDLDDMDGGGAGFHDIDPNVIFQSFFSGSGGPGGPGGGGFSFGQQGFGPGGGFSFQFG